MQLEPIPKRFTSLLTEDEYAQIVDLSLCCLKDHIFLEKVEDGVVYGKILANDVNTFGLDNIVRYCAAQNDHSVWPKIIERHFSIMLGLNSCENITGSWEDLAILRLCPEGYGVRQKGEAKMVARVDLEATLTAVALEYDNHFEFVDDSLLKKLSGSDQRLWEVAKKRLENQVFKINSVILPYGQQAFLVQHPEHGASSVLVMERLGKELIGAYGALVAVPAKGLAWICPLKNADCAVLIEQSGQSLVEAFWFSPQPISPYYYRYFQGEFTKL